MRKVLVAVLAALSLLGVGGCGRDAAWQNGYNYAVDNVANAQNVGPGLLTKSDWCAIGERYATAGPTSGDFIAGCVQGLSDSGIYGN